MRTKLLHDYYESKDYLTKLKQRADIVNKCKSDSNFVIKMSLEVWRNDPVAFIETFGWVIIPEFNNSIEPFFLFPYQKTIIEKIYKAEESGEDHEILVDKPRGMGLTWTLVWYQLWRWLFSENWGGFNLSRSEAEVDNGTNDPGSSIFGKYRWGIEHLPDWLIPEGFVPKGKKGTTTDMMLRISNPKLGSSLIGSSTNQSAGRSRRYSMTFVDECFAIEHFQSVYRSLQSVSRVKVFVSTVKAGRIYQDFKSMTEEQGNYISLSWKDHPFKDQIWYEEQVKKAEFDPEVMKEIEVDYSVNIKSQYYPEIRQARTAVDIQYDRTKPLYVGMDYGSQDSTVLIFAQLIGIDIVILEVIRNSRRNLDWYVPFLNPSIVENPDHYTPYYRTRLKTIQTWTKPVAYFGEAAHFQKVMPLNRSIADELIKNGIRLSYNNYAGKYEVRRHTVAQMLPHTVFNFSSDGAIDLYDAIANSRYADSNRGTSKESHMKPVHDDIIADYRSAFENLCVNVSRIFRNQRKDVTINPDNKQFANQMIRFLKI
jgi:hypothetical protein